jgi:hypothetical protein
MTRSYSSRVVSATLFEQTDAGVVAQHVDAPETGQRLADEALGISRRGRRRPRTHSLVSARKLFAFVRRALREATTAAPSAARRCTIVLPMPRRTRHDRDLPGAVERSECPLVISDDMLVMI